MIGRKMGPRGLLLVLVACLSLLAFAGVAQADVATVGLPFGIERPPGIANCDEGHETCSLAIRGAEAPATPTVTEEESVEEFDVDLPIKAGEYIALTIPVGGSVGQFHGSLHGLAFGGSLAVGEPVDFEGEGEGPVAIGYNATIAYQPTAVETITQEVVHTVEAPAKEVVRTVELPAGVGPEEARCVVPKLDGQTLKVAKARLRAARCKVGLVSRRSGVKAARAKVVAASPKAGAALPAGTPISLKLG
jgi:hypothetical protein